MITDHSQRLTTGRWEQAVNRAQERVNMLSLEDKLAVALHDFAAVTAEDFVPSTTATDQTAYAGATVRQHSRPLARPRDRLLRAFNPKESSLWPSSENSNMPSMATAYATDALPFGLAPA